MAESYVLCGMLPNTTPGAAHKPKPYVTGCGERIDDTFAHITVFGEEPVAFHIRCCPCRTQPESVIPWRPRRG